MSDAFDALGLPPDADERAIKRAYAAKLKTARPDEDPLGFQRLNEAYREALEAARWRREYGDDESEGGDEGEDANDRHHEESGRVHEDAAEADLRERNPTRVDRVNVNVGIWRPDDKHEMPPQMPGPPPGAGPRMPIPPTHNTEMPRPAPEIDFGNTGADPRMPIPPTNNTEMPRPAPEIDFGNTSAEDTHFDDDDAPAFDVDAFLEQIETKIHATYRKNFEQWLSQHPALRDPRIRRMIALPMLEFLEQRTSLPRGHVEAITTFFDLDRFDHQFVDDNPAAFDADTFIDTLEIAIRNLRPGQLGPWLERHPALYDIALKQRLSLPVLQFLEARPWLSNDHAEALLSFFGLDKVGSEHRWLEGRVQTLLHRMRSRPVEPSPSATPRKPSSREGSPFPIWPFFMLIYMLARCSGGIH